MLSELGGLDILVNNAGIIRRADSVDFSEEDWDAVIDTHLRSFSLWGQPSDLGGAAVFLASSASDYINGHILAVDGGWLGR
jgi:NAD(P)-dependent dehydrogenase (short-subunit alcohol dehydrogenase family)